MNEVTRILSDVVQGDAHAAGRLLPLVYDELRKLAAARMADEAPGNTLNPTAGAPTQWAHEAYLRLVGPADVARRNSRGHFFVVAEAMRRILVEAARRKRREKHGGDRDRIALNAVQPARNDLVALDAAFTRLAAEDPRAAKPVELHLFTGLSIAEAARSLGISPRTADRVWAFARAWLHRELTGTAADPEA
jgi:RNA polymerase sigma factor (TIGR02999 family)